MKIALLTLVLGFNSFGIIPDAIADQPASILEFRLAVLEQTDGYTEVVDESTQAPVFLAADNVITGNDIEKVSFYNDGSGHPTVGFILTDKGSERFWNATSKNIGKKLAIVLDGRVVSAPKLVSGIKKEGSISGHFDDDDLNAIFHRDCASQIGETVKCPTNG